MTLTEQEYAALLARDKSRRPTPRRKYNNQPVTVEGERFDSGREAERWGELQVLERAGIITKLRRQVPFGLTVNRQHVGTYTADFVYEEGGREIVEDVKGGKATRTEAYSLRRRLMLAIYGVKILET